VEGGEFEGRREGATDLVGVMIPPPGEEGRAEGKPLSPEGKLSAGKEGSETRGKTIRWVSIPPPLAAAPLV